MDTSIYKSIAERTGGDIYIGVVGPVRSGKSTFLRRFMEAVVLPNIPGEYDRNRARDEMPQSAGGRTVMTTEPKFVPDEAVSIHAGDTHCRVKMVDCVGYMIPEVMGTEEDGGPRMVHTPWSNEPVPFEEAAETGTRRVITEHATIGMLVTSDGTVGELPRDNFIGAEERVAKELTEIGKPFAIICNSAMPEREESVRLAMAMEEKYGVPVALVNCMELSADDIDRILEMVLLEFPLREITVSLPGWMHAFPAESTLQDGVMEAVLNTTENLTKLREADNSFCEAMAELADRVVEPYRRSCGELGNTWESVQVSVEKIEPGEGSITAVLHLPEGLYYHLLSGLTGIPMADETSMHRALWTLAEVKREYDRFSSALEDVRTRGYGVVMPDREQLTLEEPELVKEPGGFGVRLRASAPSIHMIRTGICAEVHPMVGTEQQSEEFARYLTERFHEDPAALWETNMLGKTLYELVGDSLHEKMEHLPPEAREKFGETLSRILNEGANGLVCILL